MATRFISEEVLPEGMANHLHELPLHYRQYADSFLADPSQARGLYRLQHLGIEMRLNPRLNPTSIPYIFEGERGANPYENVVNKTTGDYRGHRIVGYSHSKSILPDLDHFLAAMTEAMVFYSLVDPYSAEPFEALDSKIEGFLRKHAHTDFKAFIANADIANLASNDYANIASRGKKRKLFNYRTKLYLAALASAEEHGFDVKSLLEKISQTTIHPVKKEEAEPAFDYLKERLG